MNNKKKRCLAAVLAVIMCSSVTLEAFADNVPAAVVGIQDSVSSVSEEDGDVVEEDKAGEDGKSDENAASPEKELSPVETEVSAPKSYAYSPTRILTIEKNPDLFTFNSYVDEEGNEDASKANECIVSLSGSYDISKYDTIEFPDMDPDGRTVTKIGNCSGLEKHNLLKRIRIPNTVTDIAAHAFSGAPADAYESSYPSSDAIHFDSLDTVEFYGDAGIPVQLANVGNYAFAGSKSLVNIPILNDMSSLNTIGNGAFMECIGLVSVTLNSSILKVGEEAFYGCTKIKTVKINGGEFAMSAFENCSALTEASISGSTILGKRMFKSCSVLKSVEFGESVKFDKEVDGETEYAASVFEDCPMLTGLGTKTDIQNKQIKLPDSVLQIPESTFYGCSGMTKVVFPSKLNVIGESAFQDCKSLYDLPEMRYKVSESAFEGCTAIKNLNVQSGTLGSSSFAGCTALENVVLYDCKLCDSVFEDCTGLVKATIDETVSFGAVIDDYEYLGTGIFSGCEKLTTVGTPTGTTANVVKMPNTFETIPESTFEDCTSITKAVFSDSVFEIGESAFAGCIALNNIQFSDSISKIYDKAFSDCTGLKKVSVNTGSIYGSAFADCTSLVTVSVGEDVELVGESIFEGCSALKNLGMIGGSTPVNIDLSMFRSIPSYTFSDCASISMVTFPEDFCSIGEEAFASCTSIKSLTLPSKSSVGSEAFYGCTGLTNVKLNTSTLYEAAFSGCTALKKVQLNDGAALLGESIFENCTSLDTYGTDPDNNPQKIVLVPGHVPVGIADDYIAQFIKQDTLTDFVPKATFSGCTSIKEVVTTDTLECIDANAFDGCINLKRITMPESIKVIWGASFANCTSLTEFTIPKNVAGVGDSAFEGCTALKKVTYQTNLLTEISEQCFEGCTSLVNIQIPESVVSIESEAFYGCTSLPEIDLEKSALVTIGSYAFSGCTSFKSVYIPQNINKIESSAFKDCTGLVNIVADSYATIEDSVFENCTSLEEAIIFANTIGNSAFYGCTSLKDLYLSDYVSDIGSSAFKGCTSLTSIELPKYVVTLKSQLLSGCTKLKSVLIQDYVAQIEDEVFYECPSSMKIIYKGTQSNWDNIVNSSSLSAFKKDYQPEYMRNPASVINFKVSGDKENNVMKLAWLENPSIGEEGGGYKVYQWKNNSWTLIKTLNGKSSTTLDVTGYDDSVDNAFKIVAFDENNKESKEAYTALLIPIKNLKAVSVGTSVSLTWSKNPVAAGYYVWQSDDNASWRRVAATTNTSYNITGLTAGKTCYCRVTAYLGRSESPNSNVSVKVGSTPSKVSGFKGVPKSNSITLQWNKKTNVTAYKVYMWQNNSWTLLTTTANNNVLTYTKTGLNTTTTYKFRIFAYNGKLHSTYTEISVKTLDPAPAKVSNFKGKANGTDSIKLTWSKNTKALNYKIQYSTDGKSWKNVGTTKNNSTVAYTVKNLKASTAYKFRIYACGKGTQSTPVTITVYTAPVKVSGFKGTASGSSSVKLTWKKNTKALNYKIQYSTDGKSWKNAGTTKNNSTVAYTVKNLKASTLYKFRIYACGKGSTLSAPVTVLAYTAPANVSGFKGTANGSNSIKLTWKKNTKALKYKILLSTNGKTWKTLSTTKTNSTTSYTINKLNANASYKLRIIACGKGGTQSAPVTVTVKTAPAKVTGFAAKALNKSSVKLTWKKSAGAAKYKITYSTNGKTWKTLTTTKNGTVAAYTAKNLKANTKYSFRIVAVNSNGAASGYVTKTVQTPKK